MAVKDCKTTTIGTATRIEVCSSETVWQSCTCTRQKNRCKFMWMHYSNLQNKIAEVSQEKAEVLSSYDQDLHFCHQISYAEVIMTYFIQHVCGLLGTSKLNKRFTSTNSREVGWEVTVMPNGEVSSRICSSPLCCSPAPLGTGLQPHDPTWTMRIVKIQRNWSLLGYSLARWW